MGSAPSGFTPPRTNWQSADAVGPGDLNTIGQAIISIETGSRTIDPTQAPTGNVGSLRQILDWLANRIAAIHGQGNWYDAPIRSLAQLQAEKVGRGAANSDVELITALLHRIDTRQVVITYDAQGRPSTIEEKDGANVVKTVTIAYGPDGKPSQIQETAGGTTVTSTLSYDAGGKLAGVQKAVG